MCVGSVCSAFLRWVHREAATRQRHALKTLVPGGNRSLILLSSCLGVASTQCVDRTDRCRLPGNFRVFQVGDIPGKHSQYFARRLFNTTEGVIDGSFYKHLEWPLK